MMLFQRRAVAYFDIINAVPGEGAETMTVHPADHHLIADSKGYSTLNQDRGWRLNGAKVLP